MNNSDHKEFLTIMTGLVELYDKDISKSLLTIYWKALSDVDIGDFDLAVKKHVLDQEKGMFFPKPANIIKHIDYSKDQISDRIELEAMEAWSSVLNDVKRVGTYGKCASEDDNVHNCIRMLGGWNKICMSTNDEMVWIKKEFIQLYVLKKEVCYEDGLLQLPKNLIKEISVNLPNTRGINNENG